jgi:hypothetical protein
MKVAIGFRTHRMGSGGGDRRSLVLADPEIYGSKQPYRAAEPMPIASEIRSVMSTDFLLGTSHLALSTL